VFARTPAKLKAAMADILENGESDLTPRMRNLIDGLWSEWKLVDQQIEELNDELERISAADAGCTRIRKIPGIGPVVATAIVARRNLVVWKRRLRLGNATRSHFPAPLRQLKFPHRSLHRSSKDERTVTTACLKPAVTNGLQRPTSFKGQPRAQLILARRTTFHPKAD
jgi:hypothetical protein